MIAGTLSAADVAWDLFIARHPQGHVLQTSRWARLKSAFGWRTDRVLLLKPEEANVPAEAIEAGASVLFRRLPWGQTLAYVPKGPAVDWYDTHQASALMASLKATCRRHRAALIKIEPDLPASSLLADTLAALGFRPSSQRVQPLSTIHIDLTPQEDTILAGMKPKWRYNIRLAERKGVTVRAGSNDDLPAVQALLVRTGERDGFGVHSAGYYALATELFVPAGLAAWLIAEQGQELLAAIAVFAVGRKAWYMWGASSDAHRNLMPNHALQWAAIRWAKAAGCRSYDLWGIPDEVGEDPTRYREPDEWGQDGMWGIFRFKQGFGGHVVRYVGAWDLPLSAAGYALYRTALRLAPSRE